MKLVLNHSGYSISKGSAAVDSGSVLESSLAERTGGENARLNAAIISRIKLRKSAFSPAQHRSSCCVDWQLWHRIIDHSLSAPEGFILQGLFELVNIESGFTNKIDGLGFIAMVNRAQSK